MSAPSVPPPLPADPSPHPKKGMPTWLLVLLIVAGLGALAAIPCIAGMIGAVATVVPRMQERQARLTCAQNLQSLAQTLALQRSADPDWAPESGTALFVMWRANGVVLPPGSEGTLVCPADGEALPSAVRSDPRSWNGVVSEDVPPGLSSYAGRDWKAFPIPKDAAEPEPVAACIHHQDGANVAFDDGRTLFLSRADLGLAPGDPIEVGPQAKSPLLRKLCFHPGRAGR